MSVENLSNSIVDDHCHLETTCESSVSSVSRSNVDVETQLMPESRDELETAATADRGQPTAAPHPPAHQKSSKKRRRLDELASAFDGSFWSAPAEGKRSARPPRRYRFNHRSSSSRSSGASRSTPSSRSAAASASAAPPLSSQVPPIQSSPSSPSPSDMVSANGKRDDDDDDDEMVMIAEEVQEECASAAERADYAVIHSIVHDEKDIFADGPQAEISSSKKNVIDETQGDGDSNVDGDGGRRQEDEVQEQLDDPIARKLAAEGKELLADLEHYDGKAWQAPQSRTRRAKMKGMQTLASTALHVALLGSDDDDDYEEGDDIQKQSASQQAIIEDEDEVDEFDFNFDDEEEEEEQEEAGKERGAKPPRTVRRRDEVVDPCDDLNEFIAYDYREASSRRRSGFNSQVEANEAAEEEPQVHFLSSQEDGEASVQKESSRTEDSHQNESSVYLRELSLFKQYSPNCKPGPISAPVVEKRSRLEEQIARKNKKDYTVRYGHAPESSVNEWRNTPAMSNRLADFVVDDEGLGLDRLPDEEGARPGDRSVAATLKAAALRARRAGGHVEPFSDEDEDDFDNGGMGDGANDDMEIGHGFGVGDDQEEADELCLARDNNGDFAFLLDSERGETSHQRGSVSAALRRQEQRDRPHNPSRKRGSSGSSASRRVPLSVIQARDKSSETVPFASESLIGSRSRSHFEDREKDDGRRQRHKSATHPPAVFAVSQRPRVEFEDVGLLLDALHDAPLVRIADYGNELRSLDSLPPSVHDSKENVLQLLLIKCRRAAPVAGSSAAAAASSLALKQLEVAFSWIRAILDDRNPTLADAGDEVQALGEQFLYAVRDDVCNLSVLLITVNELLCGSQPTALKRSGDIETVNLALAQLRGLSRRAMPHLVSCSSSNLSSPSSNVESSHRAMARMVRVQCALLHWLPPLWARFAELSRGGAGAAAGLEIAWSPDLHAGAICSAFIKACKSPSDSDKPDWLHASGGIAAPDAVMDLPFLCLWRRTVGTFVKEVPGSSIWDCFQSKLKEELAGEVSSLSEHFVSEQALGSRLASFELRWVCLLRAVAVARACLTKSSALISARDAEEQLAVSSPTRDEQGQQLLCPVDSLTIDGLFRQLIGDCLARKALGARDQSSSTLQRRYAGELAGRAARLHDARLLAANDKTGGRLIEMFLAFFQQQVWCDDYSTQASDLKFNEQLWSNFLLSPLNHSFWRQLVVEENAVDPLSPSLRAPLGRKLRDYPSFCRCLLLLLQVAASLVPRFLSNSAATVLDVPDRDVRAREKLLTRMLTYAPRSHSAADRDGIGAQRAFRNALALSCLLVRVASPSTHALRARSLSIVRDVLRVPSPDGDVGAVTPSLDARALHCVALIQSAMYALRFEVAVAARSSTGEAVAPVPTTIITELMTLAGGYLVQFRDLALGPKQSAHRQKLDVSDKESRKALSLKADRLLQNCLSEISELLSRVDASAFAERTQLLLVRLVLGDSLPLRLFLDAKMSLSVVFSVISIIRSCLNVALRSQEESDEPDKQSALLKQVSELLNRKPPSVPGKLAMRPLSLHGLLIGLLEQYINASNPACKPSSFNASVASDPLLYDTLILIGDTLAAAMSLGMSPLPSVCQTLQKTSLGSNFRCISGRIASMSQIISVAQRYLKKTESPAPLMPVLFNRTLCLFAEESQETHRKITRVILSLRREALTVLSKLLRRITDNDMLPTHSEMKQSVSRAVKLTRALIPLADPLDQSRPVPPDGASSHGDGSKSTRIDSKYVGSPVEFFEAVVKEATVSEAEEGDACHLAPQKQDTAPHKDPVSRFAPMFAEAVSVFRLTQDEWKAVGKLSLGKVQADYKACIRLLLPEISHQKGYFAFRLKLLVNLMRFRCLHHGLSPTRNSPFGQTVDLLLSDLPKSFHRPWSLLIERVSQLGAQRAPLESWMQSMLAALLKDCALESFTSNDLGNQLRTFATAVGASRDLRIVLVRDVVIRVIRTSLEKLSLKDARNQGFDEMASYEQLTRLVQLLSMLLCPKDNTDTGPRQSPTPTIDEELLELCQDELVDWLLVHLKRDAGDHSLFLKVELICLFDKVLGRLPRSSVVSSRQVTSSEQQSRLPLFSLSSARWSSLCSLILCHVSLEIAYLMGAGFRFAPVVSMDADLVRRRNELRSEMTKKPAQVVESVSPVSGLSKWFIELVDEIRSKRSNDSSSRNQFTDKRVQEGQAILLQMLFKCARRLLCISSCIAPAEQLLFPVLIELRRSYNRIVDSLPAMCKERVHVLNGKMVEFEAILAQAKELLAQRSRKNDSLSGVKSEPTIAVKVENIGVQEEEAVDDEAVSSFEWKREEEDDDLAATELMSVADTRPLNSITPMKREVNRQDDDTLSVDL